MWCDAACDSEAGEGNHRCCGLACKSKLFLHQAGRAGRGWLAHSLREEVQILGVRKALHKLELHFEALVLRRRPCSVGIHCSHVLFAEPWRPLQSPKGCGTPHSELRGTERGQLCLALGCSRWAALRLLKPTGGSCGVVATWACVGWWLARHMRGR